MLNNGDAALLKSHSLNSAAPISILKFLNQVGAAFYFLKHSLGYRA